MVEPKFLERLRDVVGERGVVTDAADLVPYSHDWRHMFHGVPLCAVLPRSTEEVAQVVRLCAEASVPVVPYGGNTGLSGGATPDASGQQVVLSLARMNAIRHLDVVGETLEVGPAAFCRWPRKPLRSRACCCRSALRPRDRRALAV